MVRFVDLLGQSPMTRMTMNPTKVEGRRLRRLLIALAASFIALAARRPASAAEMGDDKSGLFGLSFNYPGFGLRYFPWNHSAIELRGQALKEAKLGGLRFYQYFTSHSDKRGADFYVGLEADYVAFKGDVSKGKGTAGSAFIGGEYFFGKSASVNLDFGPAYLSLTDSSTSLGTSNVDFV